MKSNKSAVGLLIPKPSKNTNIIMNQTFWLGVYPGIETEHLDYVIEKLEGFFLGD